MNILNAQLNIIKDACWKIFKETLLLLLCFSWFLKNLNERAPYYDLIEQSHSEIFNHLFPHLEVGVHWF